MPTDHLPKQNLYGELIGDKRPDGRPGDKRPDGRPGDKRPDGRPGDKRPDGRPKLRYTDVINRDLKNYGIDPMHWQTVAEERPTSLTGGSAIDIKAYQTHQKIKRARRHAHNLPT